MTKHPHKAVTAPSEEGRQEQVTPSPAPGIVSPSTQQADTSTAKYLPLFRTLLGQYVDALAAMTALGMPQYDYCRLCSGSGIHYLNCGCVCHRARKALAEYDDENHSIN